MHHGLKGVLRVIHGFLQRAPSISKSDLVEAAHVHEDTAFRHLTFLCGLGLLTAVGRGRSSAYAWADPAFKTMTADQLVVEAEAREAGLLEKKGEPGKGKGDRTNRGIRKPPTPKPQRAPSGRGSPVWKKAIAPGKRGVVWYKPDSDNLHLTFDDLDAVYEKIDPLFWIKVARDDPGRLVGFTFHHFSRFLRRLGIRPFGTGGKATLEDFLSQGILAVAWEMIESREAKSAAGLRRFRALHDHTRALTSLIGAREWVCADDTTRKILGLP